MKNTLLRNDTARHIKTVHNAVKHAKHLLLKGNESCQCTCSTCELQLINDSPAGSSKLFSAIALGSCLFLATLILVFACWAGTAHAMTPKQWESLRRLHEKCPNYHDIGNGCEKKKVNYTEEQAIKTIVGEASNQGYTGMIAVAEVIRHKTSLKGFYGLHAKHSAHEPKWVWAQARKAWIASKTSNLTKGANHFENLAFGIPYWCKSCIETFRYKDHVFFKEIV